MDGSILMVVELGCLIVPEIFINYALTDLGVFDIYFYNRVKILIIFLQKWWNIILTDYCCLILIRWREDESFKREWKDE